MRPAGIVWFVMGLIMMSSESTHTTGLIFFIIGLMWMMQPDSSGRRRR